MKKTLLVLIAFSILATTSLFALILNFDSNESENS